MSSARPLVGAMGPGMETVSKLDDVACESEAPAKDRLDQLFERQKQLMDKLIEADKAPEYPIDITSKYGQRHIKELTFSMIEELTEGTYILKNRMHRFTDHQDVDFEHFREELGDALAYFIEICVFAGIGPSELFAEYCRKNVAVKKRVDDGY